MNAFGYRYIRWVVVLLIISGSMDLFYASVFKGVFSSSSFEAFAVTNYRESAEFVSAYADLKGLFLVFLYIFGSILFFLRLESPIRSSYKKLRVALTTISLLLLLVMSHRLYQGFAHDSLPGVMGAAVTYYNSNKGIEQESNYRKNLVQQYAANVRSVSKQPELWVVVIGESMNRHHMGIYGYARNTTPKLNSIKNELFVFDNIISSHVQTQPSLRYALTLANLRDNTDPYKSLSIVDLANMSGFDTWWLSNQQPLRGSLTAIAKQAKYEYYVSNDFQGVEEQLDELLLPKLDKLLEENQSEKIVVFIHLMGSHLQYQNRYPSQFDYFKDLPPKSYQKLTNSQVVSVNAYDNSILYTDFVLSSIIERVKKESSFSGLVFFSDHGEEVYDTKNFKGHGPESLSKVMFDIPFIVWLSNSRQDKRKLLSDRLHQPAMLDHFDQFFSCLIGLQYPDQRCQDGWSDPSWLLSPRIVYGKNYDKEDFSQ